MWPSTPIVAFKATAEQFIHCLQKYCTTTVEEKAEEDCIVCTLRLCEIDGCTNDAHEEPVRLQCGHVIGTRCAATWFKQSQQCPMCRQVLFEVPESAESYFF